MTLPSTSHPRAHRLSRTLVLATLALPIAILGTPGRIASAQEEGEDSLRGFSLHDTEAARAAQREAEEHLAAGRVLEALASLQELLDEHDGEVLGATRPAFSGGWGGDRRSQQDVHPGAATWATQRLFALDPAVQDLYRKRHEKRAAAALAAAVAQVDRKSLAHTARRWPLTRASQTAWIALGDLELEAGDISAAGHAWSRALVQALGSDPRAAKDPATDWTATLAELEARGDAALASALRERIELFARIAEPFDGADPARVASALAQSTVANTPPSPRAEGWPTYTMLPGHPYRTSPDFVLHPVRWKDSVFVSTSLEVLAYESFSGEEVWRSGEAPEWIGVDSAERDYLHSSEVVQQDECFVAPAAGQGVVVAALQIPYAFETAFQFGDMAIIRPLADRRLFAFDAESGEPLWDTRPPPNWDGESGSFAHRMRVVGPPLIAGSRVLVTAARLRGRIEYHVGCFDLHSGELLWSTPVVTGQRELNMFGRLVNEFCAPPLVVAGDRVLALTQLGTFAALDLFTGDLLWEVLYDAIKIQRTNGLETRPLQNFWRNAPPVVVGDTVLATPFDGKDLIAVDIASGAIVWSQAWRNITKIGLSSNQGKNGVLNLLVGADEERVYFGGYRLVALGSSQGLVTRSAPDEVRWIFPAGFDRTSDLDPSGPRPVLDAAHLYYPGSSLFAIDRQNGQLREEMSWLRYTRGNLMFAEGMLFSLSQQSLTGYFDWERLVDQSRRDWLAAPADVDLAILFATRSRSRAMAAGDDKGRAVHYLDDAREALEPLVGTDPRVASELHEVLRTQAEVLRVLARRSEALAALEQARELAPTRDEVRDTLLEEFALVTRGRDPRRWEQALALLLERCPDLPLEAQLKPGDAPLGERLSPIVGTGDAGGGARRVDLPVGAWALLQRIEGAAQGPPSEAELADLHRLLAEHPAVGLGTTSAGAWARARIAERLRAGGEAAYAPFEERARSMYETALAADDVHGLARVSELYPHSKAANLANEARLADALERGDGTAVAAITIGELPERWNPRRANERELRHLLKLGHAFGELGNTRLRAALYAALARDHGGLRSDVAEHAGATLAELARLHAAPEPSTPPPALFDHRARALPPLRGRFEPLAALQPAPGDEAWFFAFAHGDEITAFSPAEPGIPSWTHELRPSEGPGTWEGRFLALPGRLVLATRERVLALDSATGALAWELDARGALVEDLCESEGVLAISLFAQGGWSENPSLDALVLGLDSTGGRELWRLPIPEDLAGGRILCGEGRLVLLPSRTSRRVELRDLFTSRFLAETETDGLNDTTLRAAFLAGGKLILPRFLSGPNPERNKVVGLDLDDGSETWRIDIGAGQSEAVDLFAVLTRGPAVYLFVQGQSSGAIYELRPQSGAISSAPLATFETDDPLLGVGRGKRVEIDSPQLFVLSRGTREERSILRTIQLPYGQRWQVELAYEKEEYTSLVSPALSESTVALCWRVKRQTEGRQMRTMTELVLMDRASGTLRDTRTLPPELDHDKVALVTFGDALYVCGNQMMEVLR